MWTGFAIVVAFICGAVSAYWDSMNHEELNAELAESRKQEAYNHAAKLSRVIHRQRLVINQLKKQVPAVSKKQIATN